MAVANLLGLAASLRGWNAFVARSLRNDGITRGHFTPRFPVISKAISKDGTEDIGLGFGNTVKSRRFLLFAQAKTTHLKALFSIYIFSQNKPAATICLVQRASFRRGLAEKVVPKRT